MNTKTPAMVLQEFTVKYRFPPPEYNIIMSKTGTHENEFHYQVCVANVNAFGFGRSKQVAKHNAATQALRILAERGLYDTASNPVQEFEAQAHRNESDSPLVPSQNYIGLLKEHCCDNKIPQPQFKELSDVGPPHCREFTYECTVSSINTKATAKTKKQAKQLAAKEMLDKIRTLYPHFNDQAANETNRLTERDNEAVEIYQTMTVVPNRGAKIEGFPRNLSYFMEEKSLTLEHFKEMLVDESWDNVDNICDQLEIEYKIETIQSRDPVLMAAVFGIDTPLTMMAAGRSEEDAKEKLLHEVFQTLNVLMDMPDEVII